MAEFRIVHRNEASGALTGPTRVRRFVQDDTHVFCMPTQVRGGRVTHDSKSLTDRLGLVANDVPVAAGAQRALPRSTQTRSRASCMRCRSAAAGTRPALRWIAPYARAPTRPPLRARAPSARLRPIQACATRTRSLFNAAPAAATWTRRPTCLTRGKSAVCGVAARGHW